MPQTLSEALTNFDFTASIEINNAKEVKKSV